jgi:DNA-directed RNA polymerase specialized sigma24 family protein
MKPLPSNGRHALQLAWRFLTFLTEFRMSAADPVTLWITQVKEGERAAVPRLLEQYFQRLIDLARARLRGVPGLAAYDEDVALSAFKSLCLGAERGQFPNVHDRDDLWRLMAVLTVRKAIDLQRRRRPAGTVEPNEVDNLLSREPDPELAAEMAEEFDRLLNRLGDPQLREIALWKVEGETNAAIAERLGCAERSVERKLHRVRILWREEAV